MNLRFRSGIPFPKKFKATFVQITNRLFFVKKTIRRRTFVHHASLTAAGMMIWAGCGQKTKTYPEEEIKRDQRFRISLAQWSLHRALQSGELDHLDFAVRAARDFGILGVEYVNSFFKDKATDIVYLAEMNKRAEDHGVTQVLIMVDGEGDLAEHDETRRKEAVGLHHKWVDAAATLGCHSIRVNLFGASDDRETLRLAAVQSLGELAEYARPSGINVIVENHGGTSSDGGWLTKVIREVNMDNCGTLPDFGNFCIRREGGDRWSTACIEEYDRYRGVEEMLPYAKAVSAKSYDFDETGRETTIDFARMIDMVKSSAYSGWIGVEYEGSRLSEYEGIQATKKLLEGLLT